MSKSKLIFLLSSVVFIIILIFVAMDFSSKTTFPGKKKDKMEVYEVDSTRIQQDSIN